MSRSSDHPETVFQCKLGLDWTLSKNDTGHNFNQFMMSTILQGTLAAGNVYSPWKTTGKGHLTVKNALCQSGM